MTKKSSREETRVEKEEEKNIEILDKMVLKEVELATPEAPKVLTPEGWNPKTKLGKDVSEGKITDIEKLFQDGIKITEPQIVDTLLPNLQNEIVLIGGSTGKGGGIRRTPVRRTTRMHKSGRRYRISVMVVVGNQDGYVGVGFAGGPPGEHRRVIEKTLNKAKLNLIPIRRGCGSWECKCGTMHSIPVAVSGKTGSVEINLMPAPKGVGLVVNDEVKKIMRLAGIRDIWCKSRGKTSSRINTIRAVFFALKKLNRFRLHEDYKKFTGLRLGRAS